MFKSSKKQTKDTCLLHCSNSQTLDLHESCTVAVCRLNLRVQSPFCVFGLMSTSQINSVQNTEIRASYNKAQGYATRSCFPSMANTEIKILEAGKLYHQIIPAVSVISVPFCQENILKPHSRVVGR